MAGGLDPVRVLRALARPGLGHELHALGVRNLSTFGGPDLYVPPEHESRVRELVDALENDGMQSGEAPPSEEERPWPKPMPALFSHAKIQSAVRLFDAGETRGDVIKRAELEPKDATRVRRMFTNDLLRLNAAGSRSCGSTGPGLACRASTRRSSATTTSRVGACACGRRRPRRAGRSGSSCTPSSPTGSKRSLGRERTAAPRRGSLPTPGPTRCGRRSRKRLLTANCLGNRRQIGDREASRDDLSQ